MISKNNIIAKMSQKQIALLATPAAYELLSLNRSKKLLVAKEVH